MKVVIEISEAMYNDANILMAKDLPELKKIIANGIPLPKGCRRLIILSESVMKGERIHLSFSCQKWISEMGLSKATVAIIEAGKKVEK